MSANSETVQLLRAWNDGEASARDRLIARIHPELQSIAAARLRAERGHSLSTGDLINEAVLRIVQSEGLSISDRPHLLALSSHIMRHILIDHARAKQAGKRDHVRVEIKTEIDGGQRFDLIGLETALTRLRAIDEQLGDLVEMRYYGGMTVEDVAAATGWSERTVKRRWQAARAWLIDALGAPDGV